MPYGATAHAASYNASASVGGRKPFVASASPTRAAGMGSPAARVGSASDSSTVGAVIARQGRGGSGARGERELARLGDEATGGVPHGGLLVEPAAGEDREPGLERQPAGRGLGPGEAGELDRGCPAQPAE